MTFFERWNEVLSDSFLRTWGGVADYLPNIVAAIIVFIIGWVIATLIGRVIAQLIRQLKVDNALKALKVDVAVEHAGLKLDSGAFLGGLVKWFIIIVFLIASLNALKLTQVNEFLIKVANYLPDVIVAVIILLAAVAIAEVMQKIVLGSARSAHLKSAHFLGSITKWSILIFALFVALNHLRIGEPYFQILFQTVMLGLSIAFGLSFGLGGQDAARGFVDKVRHEMTDKS
ncbi:MAG: hypothetical protein HYT43_01095 [Candidatus Taylorbacteria bacterium]|nr:hypothetical protein [Candidatus Taylorbacteria bacterium]